MMKTKYIESLHPTQPQDNTSMGNYPLNYVVFVYLLAENKVVELPILEAFVLALRMELRQLKFVITDQTGEELIKSDGSSVIVANQIDKEFSNWRLAFVRSIEEGVEYLLRLHVLKHQEQMKQAQADSVPPEVALNMENKADNPVEAQATAESPSPAKLVSWESVTAIETEETTETEAETTMPATKVEIPPPAAETTPTVKFI